MSLLLCFVVLLPVVIQAQPSWQNLTIEYLQGNLARRDGGYGWEDQHELAFNSHICRNPCIVQLRQTACQSGDINRVYKSHHPQRGKNKEAGPRGTEERDLVYQVWYF